MREPQLIATFALMASTLSVFAESGKAPALSAKPAAANAKDEKTPVSVSGMTASEYAHCVSDLTSSHVVFQQAGDLTEQGCKLSGAIRLKAVTTAVGSVSMSGEPAMLCSFAQEFSGWVREVAGPLAPNRNGRSLCLQGPLRQAGRGPERNTPKETRSTSPPLGWPTAAAFL